MHDEGRDRDRDQHHPGRIAGGEGQGHQLALVAELGEQHDAEAQPECFDHGRLRLVSTSPDLGRPVRHRTAVVGPVVGARRAGGFIELGARPVARRGTATTSRRGQPAPGTASAGGWRARHAGAGSSGTSGGTGIWTPARPSRPRPSQGPARRRDARPRVRGSRTRGDDGPADAEAAATVVRPSRILTPRGTADPGRRRISGRRPRTRDEGDCRGRVRGGEGISHAADLRFRPPPIDNVMTALRSRPG